MHKRGGAMFPIAKATLSFFDISKYWSQEIHPPASQKELLHTLERAWWLGELRGESADSPFTLLKKLFTSMHHTGDPGIVFVVGDDSGPVPVQSPDGSVEVDVRQQIHVPSNNIESWDETSCRNAIQELAEAYSLDILDLDGLDLAVGLPWVLLTYEQFTTWLRKCGYPEPTFWRPRLNNAQKKRWKARRGETLTPHEEAVVRVLNQIWPDGDSDHKAKARNSRINECLANEHHKSAVSPRTIQRTIAKVYFA
jgi:hypothetical protein